MSNYYLEWDASGSDDEDAETIGLPELAEKISASTHLSYEKALIALQGIFQILSEKIAEGNVVEFGHLGIFCRRDQLINPEHLVYSLGIDDEIIFVPSPWLQNLLNRKFKGPRA